MRAPLMTIGGAINRKLVQQLIDGLNFFDLIADIREMNDLQDDDAASDLEKESLVESFGTF